MARSEAMTRERLISIIKGAIEEAPHHELGAFEGTMLAAAAQFEVEARRAALEVVCRVYCIDCEHGLSVFEHSGSYWHVFLGTNRLCCCNEIRKLLAADREANDAS